MLATMSLESRDTSLKGARPSTNSIARAASVADSGYRYGRRQFETDGVDPRLVRASAVRVICAITSRAITLIIGSLSVVRTISSGWLRNVRNPSNDISFSARHSDAMYTEAYCRYMYTSVLGSAPILLNARALKSSGVGQYWGTGVGKGVAVGFAVGVRLVVSMSETLRCTILSTVACKLGVGRGVAVGVDVAVAVSVGVDVGVGNGVAGDAHATSTTTRSVTSAHACLMASPLVAGRVLATDTRPLPRPLGGMEGTPCPSLAKVVAVSIAG